MATIDNPAPVAGYGTPVAVGRNGMGTAGLVLGIVAIVLSWTVVGGIVLGILAVIFGSIGRGRVKRGEADNRRSANAGIITGVVGNRAGGSSHRVRRHHLEQSRREEPAAVPEERQREQGRHQSVRHAVREQPLTR